MTQESSRSHPALLPGPGCAPKKPLPGPADNYEDLCYYI